MFKFIYYCHKDILFGEVGSVIPGKISPTMMFLHQSQVIRGDNCQNTLLVNVGGCWAANSSYSISRCPEQ